MIKKIFGLIWVVITILIGVAALFVAVCPNSLTWFGVHLSQESIVFGSRVFVFTLLWFIFGSNWVTEKVAEVEKSGPIALVAMGVLVGVILEGKKLVAILQKAGFGLDDLCFMVIGILAIIGGSIWAFKTYARRQ